MLKNETGLHATSSFRKTIVFSRSRHARRRIRFSRLRGSGVAVIRNSSSDLRESVRRSNNANFSCSLSTDDSRRGVPGTGQHLGSVQGEGQLQGPDLHLRDGHVPTVHRHQRRPVLHAEDLHRCRKFHPDGASADHHRYRATVSFSVDALDRRQGGQKDPSRLLRHRRDRQFGKPVLARVLLSIFFRKFSLRKFGCFDDLANSSSLSDS